MSNPNHSVGWRPTRPELTIECVRSVSSSRCYHESWYHVTSKRPLDAEDLKRLDECKLLGIGQAYYLEKVETLIDNVPATTVDTRTGLVVDVPPVSWNGQPLNTRAYEYQRCIIKRICDSGD